MQKFEETKGLLEESLAEEFELPETAILVATSAVLPFSAIHADDAAIRSALTLHASFDQGMGARFKKGEMKLEELAELARSNGEPQQISGKQELYEAIINQYIK